MATPDERNRLARRLFAEAIVENRTLVAVKPRADLLPFFASVNWCVGGSDGLRSIGCILPTGALVLALPPEPTRAGRSCRASYQTPRRRKLCPEQAAELRRMAPGRSLRDLAAGFGVSHETIRTVLRERETAAVT